MSDGVNYETKISRGITERWKHLYWIPNSRKYISRILISASERARENSEQVSSRSKKGVDSRRSSDSTQEEIEKILNDLQEKDRYSITEVIPSAIANIRSDYKITIPKEVENFVKIRMVKENVKKVNNLFISSDPLIQYDPMAKTSYAMFDMFVLFEIDFMLNLDKKELYDVLVKNNTDSFPMAFTTLYDKISMLYSYYLLTRNKIDMGVVGKLLNIIDMKNINLRNNIIGQDNVIERVENLISSFLTIKRTGKPISSMMFLGDTGVGKTMLAKWIAKKYFNSKITIIDSANLRGESATAAVIGAPPGYLGYGDKTQLQVDMHEDNRRVILFDEIEKASRSFFPTLLSLLDEGRITFGDGETINFENTLIIFTSNLVTSEVINKLVGTRKTIGFIENKTEQLKDINDVLVDYLSGFFAPEFVGRLDEFILFNKLDESALEKIISIFESKYSVNGLIDRRKILDRINKKLGARQIERLVIEEVVKKIN